jgi:lactoylglutathione lyase
MKGAAIGADLSGGMALQIAFMATSRDQVRRAHSIALTEGGTCEGEPGLRPQYHPNYFGAYFRDTEGNKLCVVCHGAE